MVFLLVWKARQTMRFQEARATLQALLSQKGASSKEILEAFNDLRETFFPFEKNQRTEDLRRMREVLEQEVQRGMMAFRPIELPRPRRGRQDRLREPTVRRGLDPFDSARRRGRGAS